MTWPQSNAQRAVRRATLALALVGALLGLLASGCGGSSGAGGSGSGSGAGTGGQTLRLAQMVEPTEQLDPAKVGDGPTIELLMHIYEGLVQWDVKNTVVPCIAEKWDVTDGGKTYTFHLRTGVKFHNGRDCTAEDLAYSIKRSLDPKTVSNVAMSYLDDLIGAADFNSGKSQELPGVEVVDSKTLRLKVDAPKAYFLAKLTYPTAYAVCKEAIENAGGTWPERIVGTGAFKLARYDRGDRIILDANPTYWDGAPKVAHIERRILLDDGARHDKFEAGELDITNVTMAAYKADKANPKLSPLLHEFERPSVYYLALNQTKFPQFKDRRVRQAFAMAVDKKLIVESVHQGVPQVAEGVVPTGVPGHDASFKGLPYDPEKAKKLMAEAGYPGGQGFPPLTLSFRANVDDLRNTGVALADQLQKNLGIKVQPEDVEWNTFLTKREKGEMPLYFLRWAADYLDPQNFLSTMLHSKAKQNSIGYKNTEFDKLCDEADVMQDEKQRMETYHKAERIAVDDAPWVPLYFQKDVELWNPKLKGVDAALMGHLPHKHTYLEP